MQLEQMTAEQLIDLARKQEAALRQSQASYGALAMELAAAKAPACADPVVETNVALLRSRSTLGIEKYGTTLADSKAPLRDFLEHALLEMLDGANYLQTAMRKIDAAPAPTTPAASVDTEEFCDLITELDAAHEAGDSKAEWARLIAHIDAHTARAVAAAVEKERVSEMDTIRDRDQYHEWADKLAEAIAKHFGGDIGEHSNVNCPWSEAMDLIEEAEPAAAPQQHAQAALSDFDIEVISRGLKVADVLIAMIPTRLHEHPEESIALIGKVVNVSGGYNAIASAKRCFSEFVAGQQPAAAPSPVQREVKS